MFPVELYGIALEKEFSLAYCKVGAVPLWQTMPVTDRNWHYEKLVKVKEEEKRENDERNAKITALSKYRRG